ncbi:unnamed protein product [Rhizoctonia solani]|uniref:Uncharacterized protein n=1 Tax=Rhizoctonia solani TaxID=456999 RepID=A0A8H3HYN5_9AGAM|nr:unnamed protein product [Rhizoctonia solani]
MSEGDYFPRKDPRKGQHQIRPRQFTSQNSIQIPSSILLLGLGSGQVLSVDVISVGKQHKDQTTTSAHFEIPTDLDRDDINTNSGGTGQQKFGENTTGAESQLVGRFSEKLF